MVEGSTPSAGFTIHAGSSGAGFNVVAHEIKKLGEAVTVQSTETKGKLQNVAQTVINLNKVMFKAAGIFDVLIASVKRVSTVVDEVNAAMVEQNKGGREILDALKYINDTTQSVSGGSGSMQRTVQEVVSTSDDLKKITSELSSNFSEMEMGLRESTTAVQIIADKTMILSEKISTVQQEISEFKVD